jgi:transposase
VNEIRRLIDLGLSQRQIASALKIHRSTVKKYLEEKSSDSGEVESKTLLPQWQLALDWPALFGECCQGVPIKVLWEEQVQGKGITVTYEAFYKQLRRRYPKVTESMHRPFVPGERVEIDYCDGISVFDPVTGEEKKTQLFVGVLCFSRYAFAEFTWSQGSQDFLTSHRNMFEFFGGVPKVCSPDNLKSAVTKAHRYDPVINEAYTRLASHYSVAVVPARVRRPKDKAIVERTIQIFQRWFFFRVRKRRFTSLTELNQCLREHLAEFHAKKHRIFQRSRAEMFAGEKSHLAPLPAQPYQIQVHRQATLHPDCHLLYDRNYYSAPHQHRGKTLDIWASQKTVEIYCNGERVAIHARARNPGTFITDRQHYPPRHEAYWDSSLKSLRNKASKIGGATSKLIHKLLDTSNPLEHTRRCQGIVRLSERYSKEEMEQACELALKFDKTTYRFIEGVLKGGYLKRASHESKPIQRGENPYLRKDTLL